MLVIGLTGSIATGKSTVSTALRAPPNSISVIDADLIARQVVEPGTRGYARIISYFSATTPDLLVPASATTMAKDGPDGKGRPLNRTALGRRVFGDDPDRRRDRAVLNSIVHPAVRLEIAKAIFWNYITGRRAIVLDVPLLFESGLSLICGAVVTVAISDPEVQMSRLLERDAAAGLTRDDAQKRIASQGDVRVKAERCKELGPERGVVIWNDGSPDELRQSVHEAMGLLMTANPAWWSWVLLGCPPLAVLAATWAVCRNWAASKRWHAKSEASRTSS
jgi:dephospho-CoA kinase